MDDAGKELGDRKDELEEAITASRDLEAQIEKVPAKIRDFLREFREMDIPQAKAVLQGIIKTAYIYSDSRIEITAFR